MQAIWDALKSHHDATHRRRILSLFEAEDRAHSFSATADGMLFDFSKTNLDATALKLLLQLADAADVAGRRSAMFSGVEINETEGRAVLHTALRNPDGALEVDGVNVSAPVAETLSRMAAFAREIRSGSAVGAGGSFTDVVNIGIGGSDLGPAMATLALAPFHNGPRCHFVSNVDGAHIADILKGLDPKRTLLIIASKTFTTIETMTNAT
ncbi:MAG: glucose-6-phosphate isomerase, partial [Pseudomonadota bacterium]